MMMKKSHAGRGVKLRLKTKKSFLTFFMRSFLSLRFFSAFFLVFSLFPHFVFAASDDVLVDVVVYSAAGDVLENATVTISVWDGENPQYESTSYASYGDSGVTNASGRVNDMPVPLGSTFYATAVDDDGNFYALSGVEYLNRWIAVDASTIENVDTGDTRLPYIHLYEGEDTYAEDWDTADFMLTEVYATSDDTTEGEGWTLAEPPEETSTEVITDGVELEVTVYNAERNPVIGASVSVMVDDVVYSTVAATDGAGRTDGLLIPVASSFYAIATDADGQTYGGSYDYYYDQSNYWTTQDGETMTNDSTGQSRILYLHLFPAEMLPSGYTGSSADFDPETYLCGGFPDAVYADVTPEECAAIEYVQAEGIFSGTDAGNIEFDRPINRAEVTKVMIEAFDIALLANFDGVTFFPDVSETEWYSSYVYTGRFNGIVGGYPDGTFLPAATINRVELLRIFLEAADVDYSAFEDTESYYGDVLLTSETAWYMPYANYAFYYTLLDNDGSLYPSASMTRLDVIKLLYRYHNL